MQIPYALIVEDNQDLSAIVSLILQKQGFSTNSVDNVSDALIFIKQRKKPDIIFLDWYIKNETADSILNKIIEWGKPWQNIPIIVMAKQSDMGRPYQELNIRHFMEKPFDVNKIIAAIGEFLPKL